MSVQGHSGSDVTFYQDLRPDANFWRTPGPSSTRLRARRGGGAQPTCRHGPAALLGTSPGGIYLVPLMGTTTGGGRRF